MTGLPRERVIQIIEKAIQMGALKKVGEDKYEMTGNGAAFSQSLFTKDPHDLASGNWVCVKCETINNALNGMNCIKCNYSYIDNITSEMLQREKKELKFPKVTDRETLIFLLGQITGLSLSMQIPKNISFAQRFEHTNTIAKILTELMSKLREQFPQVPAEEFEECLIQLNALRTVPYLEEALSKLRSAIRK